MSFVYSLPRSNSQGRQLDLDYVASLPRDRRQEGGRGSVNNIDQVSNDLPVGLTTARSGELIDSGSLRRRTLERQKKSSEHQARLRTSTLESQISGDYRPTCETLEERRRSASGSRQNSHLNGQPETSGQLDQTLWFNWEKTFQQLDQDLKRDSRPIKRSETINEPSLNHSYDENRGVQWKPRNDQGGQMNSISSRGRNSGQELRQDGRRPLSSVSKNSWTQKISNELNSWPLGTYESITSRKPGPREQALEDGYNRTTTSQKYEPPATIHKRFASESDNSSWIERQRRKLRSSRELKQKQIENERQSQTNLTESGWSNQHTRDQSKPDSNIENETSEQSRRSRSDHRETSSRRSYSFTTDGGISGGYRFQSLPRKESGDVEFHRFSKYNPAAHQYEYNEGGIMASKQPARSSHVDSRMPSHKASRMRGEAEADKAQAVVQALAATNHQQQEQRNGTFYKSYNLRESQNRKNQVTDPTQVTLQPIGVKYLEPDEYRTLDSSRSTSLKRSATFGRMPKATSNIDYVKSEPMGLIRSQSSRNVKTDSVNHSRQQSSDGERTFTIKPDSFTRKPGSYTAKPEPYVETTRPSTLPTRTQSNMTKSFLNAFQHQKNKNQQQENKNQPLNNNNIRRPIPDKQPETSHYLNPEIIPPVSESIPVELGNEVLSKSKSLQRSSLSSNNEIRRPIPISPKVTSNQTSSTIPNSRIQQEEKMIVGRVAQTGLANIPATTSSTRIPQNEILTVGNAVGTGLANIAATIDENLIRIIPYSSQVNTASTSSSNLINPLEGGSGAAFHETGSDANTRQPVERGAFSASKHQPQNIPNYQPNSYWQYSSSNNLLPETIIPSRQQYLTKAPYNPQTDLRQPSNKTGSLNQSQNLMRQPTQSSSQEFQQQGQSLPPGRPQEITSVRRENTLGNESSIRARENALAELDSFLKEFNEPEGSVTSEKPEYAQPIKFPPFQTRQQSLPKTIKFPQQKCHSETRQSSTDSSAIRLSDAQPVRVIDLRADQRKQQATLSSGISQSQPQSTRMRQSEFNVDYKEPVPSRKVAGLSNDYLQRHSSNAAQNAYESSAPTILNHRVNGPFKSRNESLTSSAQDESISPESIQVLPSQRMTAHRSANKQVYLSPDPAFNRPVAAVYSTQKAPSREVIDPSLHSQLSQPLKEHQSTNNQIYESANSTFSPPVVESCSMQEAPACGVVDPSLHRQLSQPTNENQSANYKIYESSNSAFSPPAGNICTMQMAPSCGVIDPSLHRQISEPLKERQSANNRIYESVNSAFSSPSAGGSHTMKMAPSCGVIDPNLHGQNESSSPEPIVPIRLEPLRARKPANDLIYASTNSAFSAPVGNICTMQLAPSCGVIDPSLHRQTSQPMKENQSTKDQMYEIASSAFSPPTPARCSMQEAPACGVIDPSLHRQPPDGNNNITQTRDVRTSSFANSQPSAFQNPAKGFPERYILSQQNEQQMKYDQRQQQQQQLNYQQQHQYQQYLPQQVVTSDHGCFEHLSNISDNKLRPFNCGFTNSVESFNDKTVGYQGKEIQSQQQGQNLERLSFGPPPSCSSRDSLELETRFLSGSNYGFIPAGRSTPSASVDRSSGGSLWSSKDEIDLTLSGASSEKTVRDTYSLWYKPNMPRDQIVSTLKAMDPGSFIVRDSSSYPGALALAVKVAEVPVNAPSRGEPSDDDLVRHFLIETAADGIRLKGYKSEPAFESLASLIYQHTLTPIALPCRLILPTPALTNGKIPVTVNGVCSNALDHEQGAGVLYIHSEDTGMLTGPEAIERTISSAFRLASPQLLLVHLKVSNDGITVTDNSRKLFFRRHYPLQLITHCGFDRVNRRWTNTFVVLGRDINARIFGFVSRKMNDPLRSECHIFAELVEAECESMVSVTSRMVGRKNY